MIGTNRRPAAIRAFYGSSGYEMLSRHFQAMVGYELDGRWHIGNALTLAQASALVEILSEDDLAALEPQGAFAVEPEGFEALMVIDGVQYLRDREGIFCRGYDGVVSRYCTHKEWAASTPVRTAFERTASWR